MRVRSESLCFAPKTPNDEKLPRTACEDWSLSLVHDRCPTTAKDQPLLGVGDGGLARCCERLPMGDAACDPELSAFLGDAGISEAGTMSGSGGPAWPSGIPARGDAALLGRTRTLLIGNGLIASTGSALASSAFLNCRFGPVMPGARVSVPDDFRRALLEIPSVSEARPARIVTIAAPIAIPNSIETRATRSSRRTLGPGQKYPKSG
jgi:hypothetical protein